MTDNQDEQDVEVEFPMYIGWDAKPETEEVEQLIDKDASSIPNIEHVPNSVIEYRVDEDGNMIVLNVVIEDEVVYSSGI